MYRSKTIIQVFKQHFEQIYNKTMLMQLLMKEITWVNQIINIML